ncbi:FAD binding domain-containing protein [Pseudooceanicola algae]|uniref:FAD binding domain-containing protein n=1 Tax=Pseudooceanicola algae TaxID=1537215 RepID=UPI0018AD21D6|nr:FAD binding domain-containing protein [Pseudooceanicola algae]
MSRTPADLSPVPLYRPTTVDEAVAALQESGAAVYAGGTDFFAAVRQGLAPQALVWIAGIAEMKGASVADDVLRIGALSTHDESVEAPELDAVPGLARAWASIATVRIRNQATLGGNLMARRERYELSILLTAVGATARMAGPEGYRDMPVQDLWQADLTSTPLLVSVGVPLRGAPKLDYERSMRPTFTQALCRRGESLRLVMATEWLQPWFTDAALGTEPAEMLADLPEDFSDPAVGREHLVRAGGAFLKRQTARLEAIA